MADSVLDFAGLGEAAVTTEAPVVEAPVVETPATEAPVVETGKKEAKQQYNSDGTPKEPAADAAKVEDLPGTEKTPQEIRGLLKQMRDADPKNVAAVKQLHGAFERWEATKAIYPGGIKEMTAAKS